MPSGGHNRLDLTGQKFDRLTAVRRAPRPDGRREGAFWECLCECGATTVVDTRNLRSGNTKSCGCRRLDLVAKMAEVNYRHGHTMLNSPTYVSWQSMLRRVKRKPRYADRGIKVDPAWLSFKNFLADMGERPEETTLDRIDNNGPYTPGNCRWASKDTQDNNRENSCFLTYEGRTQTVAQWAREVGLSRGALYNRIFLYGWSLKRALETPRR